MKTCERIDDDICGHAIYAGDRRCPTCGRGLTMTEGSRNLASASRAFSRTVERNARETVKSARRISRIGRVRRA